MINLVFFNLIKELFDLSSSVNYGSAYIFYLIFKIYKIIIAFFERVTFLQIKSEV